jgi:hypothetical protein
MKQTRTQLAAGLALMLASGASQALGFNFTFVAGTSVAAEQGFIDAGARWASLFSDPVTLDMTVGTSALGTGILAETASRDIFVNYSTLKSALSTDRTTASDVTAVANLSAGSSYGVLINRTTDSPSGSGSATPYVSSGGTTLDITTANAKALGLAVGTGSVGACASTCDASIVFSNSFAFDYNPGNGIAVGQYDFVGIAAHEIGHALGFISGADIIDGNAGLFSAAVLRPYTTALDLFRYSTLSKSSNVNDITADTRAKYFSIDGGTTVGAGFSTGSAFGDGWQASHWKDNLGLGIMDPTAGTGELLQIGSNDTLALDVIGWNLVTAVPEPSTYALFAVGLAAIGLRRRSERAA